MRKKFISYGIICINTNEDIKNKIFNQLNNINNIKLNNQSNNINKDLKFVLISKNYSYSYFTLIYGEYNLKNRNQIELLISELTNKELELFKTQTFYSLWNTIKKKHATKEDYNRAKYQFLKIKPLFFNVLNSNYDNPEWEIPKGKKKNNETCLNCALREFTEETKININNLFIFKNIKPLKETFIGTDNNYYTYIYYLALVKNNIKLNMRSREASIIDFCPIEFCLQNFRSYNKNRKKLLYNICSFLN
jgi:ADP-ribose pyrophosphatase YjhB (NUDIX family)